MDYVWAWVGSGTALAIVVWLVRLSWLLRGVSDMAEAAKRGCDKAMPRNECVLKEDGNKRLLERIDANVAAIWTKIEGLRIGERLTRVETDLDNIKKRMNGNGVRHQ